LLMESLFFYAISIDFEHKTGSKLPSYFLLSCISSIFLVFSSRLYCAILVNTLTL
jgi:hypothetical protein